MRISLRPVIYFFATVYIQRATAIPRVRNGCYVFRFVSKNEMKTKKLKQNVTITTFVILVGHRATPSENRIMWQADALNRRTFPFCFFLLFFVFFFFFLHYTLRLFHVLFIFCGDKTWGLWYTKCNYSHRDDRINKITTTRINLKVRRAPDLKGVVLMYRRWTKSYEHLP